MAKSLSYSLKFFIGVYFIIVLTSCDRNDILYKRIYTQEEVLERQESLINSAGTDIYYQGSVAERMVILESKKFNSGNADVYRELGVPYLKRGMGSEAYEYYQIAADFDSGQWSGYMAYCWLYFYRDYETALERIEQLDTLTPNFVDYPQSTSVDYMRGICYLQLEDYDQAIYYLDKHLKKESEDVGPDYLDAMHYQLLGIAYHKDGQYAEADSIFNLGLKYIKGSADLYYYKSMNHLASDEQDAARESFKNAQHWFNIGGTNTRPYVEEFYAIYKEDLDDLKERF